MNPYKVWLLLVPALISCFATWIPRRWIRLCCLLIAAIIYEVFLLFYVDWAYTQTFNASDGAARSFASLFGWLIGLVVIVIPVYWVTKLIKWGLRHIKKKSENHESSK